jgi:hypothetical protein
LKYLFDTKNLAVHTTDSNIKPFIITSNTPKPKSSYLTSRIITQILKIKGINRSEKTKASYIIKDKLRIISYAIWYRTDKPKANNRYTKVKANYHGPSHSLTFGYFYMCKTKSCDRKDKTADYVGTGGQKNAFCTEHKQFAKIKFGQCKTEFLKDTDLIREDQHRDNKQLMRLIISMRIQKSLRNAANDHNINPVGNNT